MEFGIFLKQFVDNVLILLPLCAVEVVGFFGPGRCILVLGETVVSKVFKAELLNQVVLVDAYAIDIWLQCLVWGALVLRVYFRRWLDAALL
jgi:hypothetical protein